MDIEKQIKNDPLFQAQRELMSRITEIEEEKLDIDDVTGFVSLTNNFDPYWLMVLRDIKKKESVYDFQI